MANDRKVAILKDRLAFAEAYAERQRRQIEWLAGMLAKTQGKATFTDGEEVCIYLPPESREELCPRGEAGCAECWADMSEGEVEWPDALMPVKSEAWLRRQRESARSGRYGRKQNNGAGLPDGTPQAWAGSPHLAWKANAERREA